MLLLVLIVAGNFASGCQPVGSTVRCELAPPEPATPPTAARLSAPAATIGHAPRARALRRGGKGEGSQRPDAFVDDATVQRHIVSLVSIGDCTGARAYANQIGKTALADQAFNACVGLTPAAPADVASAH